VEEYVVANDEVPDRYRYSALDPLIPNNTESSISMIEPVVSEFISKNAWVLPYAGWNNMFQTVQVHYYAMIWNAELHNQPVIRKSYSMIECLGTVESIRAEIAALFPEHRCVTETRYHSTVTYALLNEDASSILMINIEPQDRTTVKSCHVVCLLAAQARRFTIANEIIETWIDKNAYNEPTKSKFYILTFENERPNIVLLGEMDTEFIEDNYCSEVSTSIEECVEILETSKAIGRLVILQGVPGTGKTYFIRSLVSQCENALFLYIPSTYVSLLSASTIMQLFSTNQQLINDRPVVFVIEDGDALLLPRRSDNLVACADLLNLTDGVINGFYDLRFVITTNTEIDEFDPAICRPGRLAKVLTFDELDYQQSLTVLRRLVKNSDIDLPHKSYSLSELYQIAYDKKVNPTLKKATIGFGG
jgi:ATP-dependent Zn protease